MKVLIIASNRSRVPFAVMPFGACVVAEAAAAVGHEARVLDLMFARDPARSMRSAIESFDPDVVGVSFRNIDNNDMKHPEDYTQELRALATAVRGMTGAEIILGGSAAGIMPEQLLRSTGLRYAVAGHGEQVFPEILSRMAEDKDFSDLPGVASLKNGSFRMNRPGRQGAGPAPSPDFRKWTDVMAYRSQMSAAPVQTKRGCPYDCIYCTYAITEGRDYRLSSPEAVVESVRRLVACGMDEIEFVDNVFNAPPEHAAAVCEALIRADTGARFQTLELNPMFVDDNLLGLMERAGFTGVGITAESASDAVLGNLRKGYTRAHVIRAAEAVARQSMPVLWMFLLGGPGEDETTAAETFGFAERYVRESDVAFFNAGIRIYPGTQIESIACGSGCLALPARDMLEPMFYVSPRIGRERLFGVIQEHTDRHMNFMGSDSIHYTALPFVFRAAFAAGVRPPLWRFTPSLRRVFRLFGASV